MEEIKYKVIGYKNGILIYSNEYLTYDAAYRKFAEKAHWEGLMMSGTVDYLRGLKENVIMGRIIPAGTGHSLYGDVDVEVAHI